MLRAIGVTNATSHFGGAIVMSVFAIFLYGQLHVAPLVLGFIVGAANLRHQRSILRQTHRAADPDACDADGAVAVAGAANLLLPVFGAACWVATIVVMRLLLTLCGPLFEVT